ncbi:MAG: DUF6705 family protein [Flavobacterium sp.]
MKKIQIILLLLVGISLKINAQQPEVDLFNGRKTGSKDNGTYYKDLQGILNPFVGTWECEYFENGINKKFVLTLTKTEAFFFPWGNYGSYHDGLLYNYQIYHNNTLIYSSIQNPKPFCVIRDYDKVSMVFVDYLRNGIMFDVDIQYALVIQQGGGGQERLYFDRAAASLWNNQYFRDHPNESYSSMPTNIFLTRAD